MWLLVEELYRVFCMVRYELHSLYLMLDRHQQTPLTPYPQQAYRKKAFEVTRHNGALPSCRSALVKTLAEIA